jgi:hypothetical protein
MKTMSVHGRMVKTNFNGGNYGYPFCDGNDKKTMRLVIPDFGESAEQMLHRYSRMGYTKITFYNVTTRVNGIYNLCAYVKK